MQFQRWLLRTLGKPYQLQLEAYIAAFFLSFSERGDAAELRERGESHEIPKPAKRESFNSYARLGPEGADSNCVAESPKKFI